MINKTKNDRINQVKYLLRKVIAKRGATAISVVKKMSELHNRNPKQASFSARQTRGTITVVELIEILDYLGFQLATIDTLSENKDIEIL